MGRNELVHWSKKIRYNCNFCGKGYARRGDAERHAVGCTANPDRECGFCRDHEELVAVKPNVLLGVAKVAIARGLDPIPAVRKASEGCPACILATVRMLFVDAGPEADAWPRAIWDGVNDFNFKAERKAWWKSLNHDRLEDFKAMVGTPS